MRIVARAYASLLVLSGAWAWWIDVSMRNSKIEHLLPDVVLLMLTLPSSLLLPPLCESNPKFFLEPFVQIGFLSVCALAQSSILFWLCGRFARSGMVSLAKERD